ncbi:MAG: RecQ family ATP-dependent DNA helicase [Bacteroidales bacterium]|nr:RecQ family ATP-dependent DNA helicase [Bacteroidales bacterium]
MSFFSQLFNTQNKRKTEEKNPLHFAMIDVEVNTTDNRIHDIGALRYDNATYHDASKERLYDFLKDVDYVCGHNIIHHDATYLFNQQNTPWIFVDTLYLSPLLFPERPYHKLVKDDKLIVDKANNPVNDCIKARDLLYEEQTQWQKLPQDLRDIFTALLYDQKEFKGFLSMVQATRPTNDITTMIRTAYRGKICEHTPLENYISNHPCALAYALALINTTDHRSVTPRWVTYHYPEVDYIIHELRHHPCSNCEYCNTSLDLHKNLKIFFGYNQFRSYEGEPLQEYAAKAAVTGKSLLAVFPTGGGKSLTFQLPALMESRSVHGLTVIISPLQSLMKDQVDNLAQRGITDAVTINGLLDPITRALSIERVENGDASLLYISPEMLRSHTIEKILMARHVVRFVIDEAHCFSAWGQDFRVDYLYIGKFISNYQKQKGYIKPIPVSCFTATAKQKVIQDICDYFKKTLGITLEIFASKATRTNLRYSVIHTEDDNDKYIKLRQLIAESDGPTIVYVSRTRRTKELSEKLSRDGFKALPFNGKMDAEKKIAYQEAFMNDEVRIIVATSAFGMGVDKSDVSLVVHYDISDSLENYVQESGRAGRDPHLHARCYVLFNDNDLDKHFILLNQTKLSLSEIQQVWKAIKDFTKQREKICCSALEIARQAGWNDTVSDIETRVRTAIAALEQSGYIERGNNVPHVYATGITVQNMDEARTRLEQSTLFEKNEIEKAARIIKSLLSSKYVAKAGNDESESRIDYLADVLGLKKQEVISIIERMRQEGMLADTKDLSAFILDNDTERKTYTILERFSKLEEYIIKRLTYNTQQLSYKQLNDNAIKEGITTSKEKDIRTLLYFLTIKGYIHKKEDGTHNIEIIRTSDTELLLKRFEQRNEICRLTIDWLYRLLPTMPQSTNETNKENTKKEITFSVIDLLKHIRQSHSLLYNFNDIQLEQVEEALLYLSKINALKLEGGFLVIYNSMELHRKRGMRELYKQDDYRTLNEFYRQKMQQIHIVGEYANLMVRDYNAALQFVSDYFQIDHKKFISKYFRGERAKEILRNITPKKFEQYFGALSEKQMEIINNTEARCVVVAAGPGSGKTRVLIHKLAAILTLEDVKHEQLLMLTFSRAAATEFKQRLITLIGNAAHYIEIKTFHSYCFDLLGRIGDLDAADNVVKQAAQMIQDGEVEPNRISKTMLVIDEAQDMSADEYALVSALLTRNEEMRVLAVGDDDQNIYEFRGSSSRYMKQLVDDYNGHLIEMVDNYRSTCSIVDIANSYVTQISQRMKTTPIRPTTKEMGMVTITHYNSKNIYEPLVDNLIKNRTTGTTAILTQTNEEAAMLVALLHRNGINSKLVQALDGMRFYNLAEIRYFMKHLNAEKTTSIIDDNTWEKAKQDTFANYATSKALPHIQRCIEQFEQTNKLKYYTDFNEYVFESTIEDFYDFNDADIIVSTIHKAKGHEFDDVYLMITNEHQINDEQRRCFYVAMTRAKKQLFIHTNTTHFNNLKPATHKFNNNTYDLPNEIVLQLTHRDVVLSFFKEKKTDVLKLRSGDSLTFNTPYICNTIGVRIAKISQKMIQEITQWEKRGYHVKHVSVRFIVAWHPSDAPGEKESAVLLADMSMEKNSQNTDVCLHK